MPEATWGLTRITDGSQRRVTCRLAFLHFPNSAKNRWPTQSTCVTPLPRAGEVLVRVAAASVNPLDYKRRAPERSC